MQQLFDALVLEAAYSDAIKRLRTPPYSREKFYQVCAVLVAIREPTPNRFARAIVRIINERGIGRSKS